MMTLMMLPVENLWPVHVEVQPWPDEAGVGDAEVVPGGHCGHDVGDPRGAAVVGQQQLCIEQFRHIIVPSIVHGVTTVLIIPP